ncbi:hypothetical protein [Edwardsiella tarda]|uniref:hypothetical protein n=1 Tax=Edwardsiella tarda TaxID=636 RepID=UPI001E583736|nr:hypothetical protein [Edwardsiella tarda]
MLEEKIKQQNSTIISEKAFDLNLLQEIQEPQELNMMLKRVIDNITVFNSGKKWRIKIQYRNKHSQNFLWDGEKISFRSDTNKLLKFTKHSLMKIDHHILLSVLISFNTYNFSLIYLFFIKAREIANEF